MMGDVWTITGGVATYGAYEVIRRKVASRPYTRLLSVFGGTNEVRDDLLRLRGRTINFDTALDFSVWNEFSYRVAAETEYRRLLHEPASELNYKSLPLYTETQYGTLDSFSSIVVAVRDSGRLKFSHGGTGVIQILLKGRFEVEVGAYSGPSVEVTLREV